MTTVPAHRTAEPPPERGVAGVPEGEPEEDEDITLIFFHIPKTGGQTLAAILRQQYAEDRIFQVPGLDPYEGTRAFEEWPREKRAAIRVISGHAHFGVHESVPGPCTYFTMLRSPVDRVLSTYYYVRRRPNHPAYEAVVEGDMDVAETVRSGVLPMLDNGQTRILSGLEHWDVPYGECGPDMLARAKENLRRHFSVVGTTARFDTTLRLLQRRFGWKRVFYVRRNKTPKRPGVEDLAPETLKTIRRYSRLDRELHEFASRKLDAQVADAGPAFALSCRLFRGANRAYQTLLRLKARLS